MTRNHWNCTKFADRLRGTAKPSAATSEGWAEWEDKAKEAHPFRYWLVETALDNTQDFVFAIPDKLRDIKYYVQNRWVNKSYALKAYPESIKRGQWCDLSHRMLPCLFDELVEFVEVEQAWSHCLWSDDKRAKFNQPWWNRGWLNFHFAWRCPEAGLEYLDWAATLTNDETGEPTPQAEGAKEIKELYLWYKEIYPNRPDPYDESGWSDHCEKLREHYGDRWLCRKDPNGTDTGPMLDKIHEMEEAYNKEDTEMMCRLIKVRHSLWT